MKNVTAKTINRLYRSIVSIAFALSLLLAIPAMAQMPGDFDLSFDPGSSINSLVRAVAVQTDGKCLIAGSFTTIHGAARGKLARLNADGSTDQNFMAGLAGADNDVYAMALQSDGKILVGGVFTNVNGIARSRIARLNTDGTVDSSFGEGVTVLGTSPSVNSIVIQNDGKILVGGKFTSVNGTARGALARLNADGALDSSFGNGLTGLENSGGFPAVAHSIAVQSDGRIFVGGEFSAVNGTFANKIARLNEDGTLDGSFMASPDGTMVKSVVLQSDGKILIGGFFTTVSGLAARGKIARLNTNGTPDLSFGAGQAGTDNTVLSIAIQSDGKILIGGMFFNVNGTSRNHIARLNSDGSSDTNFVGGLVDPNADVYSVALQSDGKILIGGWLTMVNGTARDRIARLNTDGTLDSSFDNGPIGANGTIGSIALHSNGKVLMAGGLTRVNDTARNRIARLNADGTLDNSFANGMGGANSAINSLAVQSDAKILISGSFTTVNGTNRNRIARLNEDGTLDSTFGNGLTGANTTVNSVTVQSDGKILMGGDFITVNGTSRTRIARLNGDGTLDTTFGNGLAGAISTVNSIAVQSDGKILIGGFFTAVNGTSRNRIARLNGDGTLDSTFGNGLSGANHPVNSIVAQSDGKILIGGDFSTVNGTARGQFARLQANGTLDTSFGNGLAGANNSVASISLQPDGKLFIGGGFTTVNGTSRTGIARVNVDGTLDNSFGNGLAGANLTVFSIAIDNGGKVLIGGGFTAVNGQAINRVARLYSEISARPLLTLSHLAEVLTLSWAEPGFKLQAQTNSLEAGSSTNWHDYPGGGASPVNAIIDPANAAVFFRLAK